MSRAFVKEDTAESFEDLPERPVSEHPNYVTPEGLVLIEAELARISQEHAAAVAASDRALLARTARDLRYWTARGERPADPARGRLQSGAFWLHRHARP